MAISVNCSTKVISVPQSDLTSLGGSRYELDVDWFREQLKDWEDSEEGMVMPDTHRHNTTVTLSGVTYARVVEIINGYTVDFEDGTYAVVCVGANHNLADVKVVDNVSLIIGNSAGLIVTSGGGGGGGATAGEIADAVWDEARSGHTTSGTFGESVNANLTKIDGQETSGNNATLNLKQLNVVNNAGTAIVASSTGSSGHGLALTGNSTGHGLYATTGTGDGIRTDSGGGSGAGMNVSGSTIGKGLKITGGSLAGGAVEISSPANGGYDGVNISSAKGWGMLIQGGTNQHGLYVVGSGTGSGFVAAGGSTSGKGIIAAGGGTGAGMQITGGATGNGMNVSGGGTSGKGIQATGTGGQADIDANIDGEIASCGSLLSIDPSAVTLINAENYNYNGSAPDQTGMGLAEIYLGAGAKSWDNAYKGMKISLFSSGGTWYENAEIIGYVGSTRVATVDHNWNSTPGMGDIIRIWTSDYVKDGLGTQEKTDVANAVWNEPIDGTKTAKEIERGTAAALLGKSSGHEDGTPKYRDISDTKNVISATTDADGNRTGVTLNLT